jgi:hypothetical protein
MAQTAVTIPTNPGAPRVTQVTRPSTFTPGVPLAKQVTESPADELARLQAENAALKAKLARPQAALSMRVSEKGALSLYGLGRFPLTLYRGQWERVLGASDAIRQFLADHVDELATKA